MSTYQLRLGEILIQAGFVSEPEVQRALEFQTRFGGELGAILIRMGALSEDHLLMVLSEQLHFPILESKFIPTEASLFLETIEKTGIDKEWWLDQEIVAWETPDVSLEIFYLIPFMKFSLMFLKINLSRGI